MPADRLTTATSPPGRAWLPVCVAVVAGAVLIGLTLRVERGSAGFYVAGYALAAVWIGASVVGSRHQRFDDATPRYGRLSWQKLGLGAGVGVAMFLVFVVGAAVGRRISVLEGPIETVLARADTGPIVAVLALALVNAVAEEMFFRGLVIERAVDLGRWQSGLLALALYVGVSAVGGNTALTLAAAVMGIVFTAQRVMGADLVVPITTHVVWSTLMLLALPR